MSLDDWARALGHLRWVELRLFEVLGAWVRSVPEPEAKVLVATHSRHHAWHAELWSERLPRIVGTDTDALTAPASEAVGRAFDAVARPEEPDETIEKLAGVYRAVLPRLVGAYAELRESATPPSDGPFIRWLDVVLTDETRHSTDAEPVLQSLSSTPGNVRRAAQQQAAVERLLGRNGFAR